jgi:hypothetical protein
MSPDSRIWVYRSSRNVVLTLIDGFCVRFVAFFLELSSIARNCDRLAGHKETPERIGQYVRQICLSKDFGHVSFPFFLLFLGDSLIPVWIWGDGKMGIEWEPLWTSSTEIWSPLQRNAKILAFLRVGAESFKVDLFLFGSLMDRPERVWKETSYSMTKVIASQNQTISFSVPDISSDLRSSWL